MEIDQRFYIKLKRGGLRLKSDKQASASFCFKKVVMDSVRHGVLKINCAALSGKRRSDMKINIIGRQLNVYEDTKEMIISKLSKLDKYFGEEGSATVTLSHKRNLSTLEVTIKVSNTLFRSEVDAESFRDALDKSIDNIERQIRKNKTRLRKKLREGIEPELEIAPTDIDEQDGSDIIIRTKKFEYTPMSPEEAIMQMNLLGHTFFVFNDAITGKTCVVYTRKDGNYGLIEPEI